MSTENSIKYATISVMGSRKTMEDTYVINSSLIKGENIFFSAVFDGHGGNKISKFLAENIESVVRKHLTNNNYKTALNKTFHELNNMVSDYQNGSTATCVLIDDYIIAVASVGDSRAAIFSYADNEFLTPIHRLINGRELYRIVLGGGLINGPYIPISSGYELMTTRAIGNRNYKKSGIISTPSISLRDVSTMEENYLLIATDGLWDSLDMSSINSVIIGEGNLLEKLHKIEKLADPEDNLTAILMK